MRYDPPGAVADVTLGLVGKAITFDSGGISLKPPLRMQDMKGDMAGGAAVIEGAAAIAELGLPVRVVAVVASSENIQGGSAFKPGDILRASNGKTIEIVNTDAEGRLVLADALHHARGQGATHVIDFATLTGAMSLALGDLIAGWFANDEDWAARIEAATRDERRPRLPVPAPPALPSLHRLELRRHEERLRAARGRRRCSRRCSCRSSRAKAHGRTSTWPGRDSSSGGAPTTRSTRAAPATASA